MKIRVAIAAAALCGLFACTQATTSPPPQPTESPAVEPAATVMELTAGPDEPSLTIARAVIAPSAEMLRAALAGDPDAMRAAATATATCQAASTCPAQFGSCSSWSTPSLCSQTCGAPLCRCRPIRDCPDDPPEPSGTETYNSFRVCFDPNQNACTEWSNTKNSFCGC